jgi:hypothetical protein
VILVLANTSQDLSIGLLEVTAMSQTQKALHPLEYPARMPLVTLQTLPLFVVRLQELEELRHQRVFLRLPIFVA